MAVSDPAVRIALTLIAAELRSDREGALALVADRRHLDEVAAALARFAAEAARLAARRELPDEALADLVSSHLIRLASGG